MLTKLEIPKKKKSEPVQTPEEVFAEVTKASEKNIKHLARLLEWKEETIVGLIIEAINEDKFYWRGITPYEIAAQQLYWQTNFGYLSRKQRRETFLSNL